MRICPIIIALKYDNLWSSVFFLSGMGVGRGEKEEGGAGDIGSLCVLHVANWGGSRQQSGKQGREHKA